MNKGSHLIEPKVCERIIRLCKHPNDGGKWPFTGGRKSPGVRP